LPSESFSLSFTYPVLASLADSVEGSLSLAGLGEALALSSTTACAASPSPGVTQITGSAGAFSAGPLAAAASGLSPAVADGFVGDSLDLAFAGCADNEETKTNNRQAVPATQVRPVPLFLSWEMQRTIATLALASKLNFNPE